MGFNNEVVYGWQKKIVQNLKIEALKDKEESKSLSKGENLVEGDREKEGSNQV